MRIDRSTLHRAVLEEIPRIGDDEIAAVPEVAQAAQRLAEAAARYAKANAAMQALRKRVEGLQRERNEAASAIAVAEHKAAELAVWIVEGDADQQDFDELLDAIACHQRILHRIDLARPVFEARLKAAEQPARSAADHQTDAGTDLEEARFAAKVALMQRRLA